MLKLLANDGILRRIVESAAAAPSIHNTQPWQFTVVADDLLEVRADPGRTLWVGDPRARALYLSCGAALFNIRTAIRMTGFNPRVWPLPHPEFDPAAIPDPQGRQVVFACRSGNRSVTASLIAQAAGLPYDAHLGGGMKAWKALGLPTES